MGSHKKIVLLTLLGLILPLGNIWGPFLIRIPKSSQSYKFRKKLITFETILTSGSFILAIIFNIKGIASGFNPNFIRTSAYILTAQYIAIIVTAIIATIMTPKSCL